MCHCNCMAPENIQTLESQMEVPRQRDWGSSKQNHLKESVNQSKLEFCFSGVVRGSCKQKKTLVCEEYGYFLEQHKMLANNKS